jgi:pimeloyl-ACP methyl ester carboxylesterase
MSALREQLLSGLPVAERRLELCGISTPVLEGGSGAPIVLLHGQGAHAAKWLRVLPDLGLTHRVIAPDLPGHGGSDLGDEPLEAHRVLPWLDALLDATCDAEPVLVGHGLGGAIAARYAGRHGGRLRRLILVDSFGLGRFRPAPRFAAALVPYLAHPTERTHDRLWRRCAADFDAVRAGLPWEPFRAYNLDRARTPSGKAALRVLMSGLGVPRISPDELARIATPTALIWGRHDLTVRLDVARAASAVYGWSLQVLDDCGGDPPIEAPEAFVRALRVAAE